MIRKVNTRGNIVGTPKIHDKLVMHNTVFSNDDYTKLYSGLPKDTIYEVISSVKDAPVPYIVIQGPPGNNWLNGLNMFTCKDGFDKYFKYHEENIGALYIEKGD